MNPNQLQVKGQDLINSRKGQTGTAGPEGRAGG